MISVDGIESRWSEPVWANKSPRSGPQTAGAARRAAPQSCSRGRRKAAGGVGVGAREWENAVKAKLPVGEHGGSVIGLAPGC